MKTVCYWIVAKPKKSRDYIMLAGVLEGQCELSLLSILPRMRGELFTYLGISWVVTDCYPA